MHVILQLQDPLIFPYSEVKAGVCIGLREEPTHWKLCDPPHPPYSEVPVLGVGIRGHLAPYPKVQVGLRVELW